MLAETVNIAQTIVFGVAFDPKNNDRVRNMDLNRLFASVGELFDLFAEREIEHVLVGGIAMLAYVEGRNTQDIDFIISAADLKKLPEIRVEEQNAEFARTWLGDLRVDFLFTKNKLFKLVLQKYSHRRKFADRLVPCATEEGLLLLKLFAIPSLYRQGLFPKVRIYENDVAELISRAKKPIDPLIKQLEPLMVPSDIDELRKIVADIERRQAEGPGRFSSGDGNAPPSGPASS
jgi:hypothetical protein